VCADKATGATAVVPGSHKLVPEINAFRKSRKDADGKYIGPAVSEAADVECFTANGLTPCVSCIRAGDLVIFGACAHASYFYNMTDSSIAVASILRSSIDR
jgi:ectoine hydroxylase-related dioxygenase (phytanoyl-CoA dioxygenase family)